jgi:uncharacterized damage-inducible protein DinB
MPRSSTVALRLARWCTPLGKARERAEDAGARRASLHPRAESASDFPGRSRTSAVERVTQYDRPVNDPARGIAPFYEGWRKANSRLVDALANLSDDQLALRARPDYWPIWAIAGHTAGARVYWLCGVLKEAGLESTPFTEHEVMSDGWEDHEDQPRAASELVEALTTSWKITERCLMTWTPEMLAEEFRRMRDGNVQIHTRQSVLMRLITHDAFHAGEISVILGMHRLPEIDLWRPASPATPTR